MPLDTETLLIVLLGLLVVGGALLAAQRLISRLTVYTYRFGALLFDWAAEWAWLGFISYVAAWVFMFPVMLIICMIGGAVLWYGDRIERREAEVHRSRLEATGPNKPSSEAEALRWEQEDRSHGEARQRFV